MKLLLITSMLAGSLAQRPCVVSDLTLSGQAQRTGCTQDGYAPVVDYDMCKRFAESKGSSLDSGENGRDCVVEFTTRYRMVQPHLPGGHKMYRVCAPCDCDFGGKIPHNEVCPTPKPVEAPTETPAPVMPPTEEPVEAPTETPAPAPSPTVEPTEGQTDPKKLCARFHGDKKACKSSQVPVCSWDKKKDKCQWYTCDSFNSKGWKCDRQAAKFDLTCYWDFDNEVCTPNKGTFPCAMMNGDKKGCRKKIKTQAEGNGCKWEKSDKSCTPK